MTALQGPALRWLEAAAIVLLLFSAMIEPRVTLVLAVAMLAVGSAVAILPDRSGRSGQRRP